MLSKLIAVTTGLALVTFAPIGSNLSSVGRLASTVRCEDCVTHQNICCADCSAPASQSNKCTVGTPWCN